MRVGGDTSADVVKFGDDLELDRGAYALRRSGRVLKLERIPMEILLLLVERRGQLVGREEIIGTIWGKDVFLDTDSSINSAIRKIRQVLKDDPENPIFLQTVTGKGYRFIAAVSGGDVPHKQQADAGNAGGKANESETVISDDPIEIPVQQAEIAQFAPPAPARSSWSLRRILSLAALVVLLATGIYLLRVRSHSAVAQRRVMLAPTWSHG